MAETVNNLLTGLFMHRKSAVWKGQDPPLQTVFPIDSTRKSGYTEGKR